MECPQCQSSNPPAAVRCARCDALLPGAGRKLAGQAVETPRPDLEAFADLEKDTPVNLEGATLGGNTSTPANLEAATLAEQLTRTAPADPNATVVDKGSGAGGVTPGWSVPATAGSTEVYAASLAALQPGAQLGDRYEIIRQLGQGGMGAVYQARDRELDRMVALKVIRPELAGHPEILQRFKHELILARQVTHRNVIRIFDLGEAGGIKFITMEYIEGRDLRSLLIEKGKLPPAEAVAIIEQVCLALEAAHSEGVVHRDLKPQNIMVDGEGKASVMDFGIARSVEFGGMTLTGALVGTPEYMSPEQVQGEKADVRSDLFTLGIIFYELLTGRIPFLADTALGTMYKRIKERAVPLARFEPGVPGFLSDVVAKCLELDPQQRYQSAREILQDLDAWKAGVARSTMNPAARWLRYAPRYQKWLAAGVAACALAFTGYTFRHKLPLRLSMKPGAAEQPVSLAILPFRNASGDAAMDWLGPSLAEMLRTDVGQSASLRTVSSDRLHQILKDLHIPANADFDPDIRRHLAEFSSAETLVWGRYVKIGDQIRIDATLEDLKHQRSFPLKAEAPNEKQLLLSIEQLAQAIQKNLALSPAVLKELRAKSLRPSSNSLEALRDYNEGLDLLRQGKNLDAAKRFEAAVKQDAEFALAYSRLGQTYANLGYDDKAEQFSRKAIQLAEKLPPQEKHLILANHARIAKDNPKAIESYENLAKVSPDDPDVQFTLAELYENTGSFDLARQHYAKVLERDPKYVDALLATGRVKIRGGNPQGALEDLNRALSLSVQLENQEEKAAVLQAIGVAYKRLNKLDEALKNYQDSLEIKRRLGQKRGIAASLNEIAQIQGRLGKPEAALASYTEALALRREIGDKQGIGSSLIDLGFFYADRGRYDEALKFYKDSLSIQRELGNKNLEALCLNNIGNVLLLKGQSEDALTYLERALELREKGKAPADTALTLHNLAETSSNLGQYDKALSYYLRALETYRAAGDKRGAAIESGSMARVFEHQGRYAAAAKSTEDALKTFRELNDRSFLMYSLASYGNALSLLGRFDDARTNLEEALKLARELENKPVTAEALNFEGDAAFYRGDLKSARTAYEQALQVASQTTDHGLILLSKANRARVSVKEGHGAAAISALKTLAREADTLGLKYLATECTLDAAEALVNTRQYAAARQELETTLRTSEKLGMRELLTRGHYLLAQALSSTGNKAESSRHAAEARRILEEIRKEADTSTILERADLRPIAALPARIP